MTSMRFSDYVSQSFTNLRKKKLRTFLTTFGVVIGIGALVSMLSFGKGVQKNITDQFVELDLFNYISVYSGTEAPLGPSPHRSPVPTQQTEAPQVITDELIDEISRMEGVEFVFPEIRFPASLRFREKNSFSLIQVLPAKTCQSGLMKLRAGESYADDDANSVIISDTMLRRLEVTDPESVLGETLEVATVNFNLNRFLAENVLSREPPDRLPFSSESYTFTIVGVAERMGFGGPTPLRSEVYIPPGPSAKMKKISMISIWDFFQPTGSDQGYSAINIKLSSVKYVDRVKTQVEQMGFETFALIDQLEEIKTGFLFMDMFLIAVGMIAIVVSSLGIINTMVMSILERYKEIGIMKAVGATDSDVKRIFFFEAGVIGFLGGVFGLGLGCSVSMIINRVVNHLLARQGVPHIDYFSYPWWLCLGSIAFAIIISLAAGIYPTLRAARVDPVIALRHD
ncbi:MAG: ABC transporter permease [Planctomycetes bacterium]|nr:ABC transporter permease [Planctomycetota bacterium]